MRRNPAFAEVEFANGEGITRSVEMNGENYYQDPIRVPERNRSAAGICQGMPTVIQLSDTPAAPKGNSLFFGRLFCERTLFSRKVYKLML